MLRINKFIIFLHKMMCMELNYCLVHLQTQYNLKSKLSLNDLMQNSSFSLYLEKDVCISAIG
jgi:hypothetical protein